MAAATAAVALACVDGAGSLVNIDVEGLTMNLSSRGVSVWT